MNAGYDAGLIASSLFASRIIANVFWGYISDKKGRKLPLIISATGLALSTLAFGFSISFYWALVTRFILGFISLSVLCKSKLADVCDETNFPLGYSILISSSSVGRIFGPSIAGFLVFPAEQYPRIFSENGVFARFPILLPMLILVTGLIISNTFMILYLPQDKKRGKDETAPLIVTSEKVLTYNGYNGDKGVVKEASSDCEDYNNISSQSDDASLTTPL